jgi:hypothetical protein
MDESGGGKKIKVVRVGDTAPPEKVMTGTSVRKTAAKKSSAYKKPKFGILKGGKTARNKPRFEAVRDPAKSPPMKKSLRILTNKGQTLRRRRIVDHSSKTSLSTMRHTLRRHGLPVKDSTPDTLVRKIYEDAQEAGMISS